MSNITMSNVERKQTKEELEILVKDVASDLSKLYPTEAYRINLLAKLAEELGYGKGYQDAKDEPETCQVPPEGWWCSRDAGHEGPCAARPKLYGVWCIEKGWWTYEPDFQYSTSNEATANKVYLDLKREFPDYNYEVREYPRDLY